MSEKRKATKQRAHSPEKVQEQESEPRMFDVPNAPSMSPPPLQLTADQEGEAAFGPSDLSTESSPAHTLEFIFAGSGYSEWDPDNEERDAGPRMQQNLEDEDQIIHRKQEGNTTTVEYAGPLGGLGSGVLDTGGNSTENNAEHAEELLISEMERLGEQITAENPLRVPIMAHSRGAAMASQFAAKMKRVYGDRIKINVVMFDPVPGYAGEKGLLGTRDSEVDLAEVDNSTWILAVNAGWNIPQFQPQNLTGVTRLIVSTDNNQHGAGITAEAPFLFEGKPVDGMALSELPAGVYIADPVGNLAPITSHEAWVQWWTNKGHLLANGTENRNTMVPDAVDSMFGMEAGSTPTPNMHPRKLSRERNPVRAFNQSQERPPREGSPYEQAP